MQTRRRSQQLERNTPMDLRAPRCAALHHLRLEVSDGGSGWHLTKDGRDVAFVDALVADLEARAPGDMGFFRQLALSTVRGNQGHESAHREGQTPTTSPTMNRAFFMDANQARLVIGWSART
jgi:hypothetical protein